jgi:hypothetical protein
MTSYAGQQLGHFAHVNAVKSRIIGGGHQHSRGGIKLGPMASATTIDGVYAELSTGAPYYVQAFSAPDGNGNYHYPQHVTITGRIYVNLHQEVIGNTGRFIKAGDANVKLTGWSVDGASITNFAANQVLIEQNDLPGQSGNTFANIKPLFIPAASDVGTRFVLRGNYANAEAWLSKDVEAGTWTPSLGGTATYTARSGTYRRDGNRVTVTFDIAINAVGSGSASSISGLPYTNGASTYVGEVGYFLGLATSVVSLNLRIDAGESTITLTGLTAAGTGVPGTLGVLGNGTRIIGSATYMAAA